MGNETKQRYDLLPTRALRETVLAFMSGIRDGRPAWGWLRVEDWRSEYYSALLRHLEAWRSGERSDAESGLSPLAHVAANALILLARELGERMPFSAAVTGNRTEYRGAGGGGAGTITIEHNCGGGGCGSVNYSDILGGK